MRWISYSKRVNWTSSGCGARGGPGFVSNIASPKSIIRVVISAPVRGVPIPLEGAEEIGDGMGEGSLLRSRILERPVLSLDSTLLPSEENATDSTESVRLSRMTLQSPDPRSHLRTVLSQPLETIHLPFGDMGMDSIPPV